MNRIYYLFLKYSGATTVAEVRQVENRISFLLTSLSYAIAALAYIVLFPLMHQFSIIQKVVGIIIFSISSIGCFFAFRKTLKPITGSITLIFLAIIPFVYTWFVSIKTIGWTMLFAYWFVLLIISFFRSEYLYLVSLLFVSTLVIYFNFFKGMNIFAKYDPVLIMAMALAWAVILLTSLLMIYMNRMMVKSNLYQYSIILSKNAEIEEFTQELESQNRILTHKNTKISELNKALDTINCDLTKKNNTLQKKQADLHFLAYYDAMTHIPNRRTFIEELQNKLVSEVGKKTSFAVIFIDIDNFKHINDTIGHDVGDKVIIAFAARLNNLFKGDFVGRLGGDEFGVIKTLKQDEVIFIADIKKMKLALEEVFFLEELEVMMTTSIGIAYYPQHSTVASELLKFAEIAMHNVKNMGRNAIYIYEKRVEVDFKRKVSIARHFKTALDKNELYLEYQPILDLRQNKILGCEVLLRWKSEKFSEISPAEFIPIAEASGAIFDIGRWVFGKACENYIRITDELEMSFYMSINVSSFELMMPNYVENVKVCLNRYQISPKNIVLEITESTILKMTENVLSQIKLLQKMGFIIAVDDFGSGFFSYDYFLKLNVNLLKVDKSLTDTISDDKSEGALIIRSLKYIHAELSMHMLCEGVETAEQFDYIKKLDYDYIQGYYISKPIKKEALVEFVKKWNQN